MEKRIKLAFCCLGALGASALLMLVLSVTRPAHAGMIGAPPVDWDASPRLQESPVAKAYSPAALPPDPQLVADLDVTLQPGVLHRWVIGPSSACGGYLVEATPLQSSTDGAHVPIALVRPEYEGDQWKDVLRVQIPGYQPPLQVNLRVYKSCQLKVATEFEETLSAGDWVGWTVGPASMDRGFIVEVTPLEPSIEGAYVERALVQEEFFMGEWLDVLRVQMSEGQPDTRVHLRVYTTDGMPVLVERELVLEPGFWTPVGLRPSSAHGWYVVEINPRGHQAGEYVQTLRVQPEYNGRHWNDMLRLQTPGDEPQMRAQVRVYVWGEPQPRQVFLPLVQRSEESEPPDPVVSKSRFQVFILNPVRTCLVGNDFASGTVCRGPNCGDCDCTWEEFDPPAPLFGVSPDHVNDPEYADYDYKECVTITLTPQEIDAIIADMELVRDQVLEWSGGTLDLQMEYTVLPHDYVGSVAPHFAAGPLRVDDELLNPYVTAETDFVYVVNGVYDRAQGLRLAYWCGSSYGSISVRGAGYATVQYGPACNSITIAGERVYEALLHEWMHNLDWALYHINLVPDLYQHAGPDWENWDPASWPACDTGAADSYQWFPSVDLCEWDPDWIDCNNVASAGRCVHAGEVGGQISWYEHVIAAHYPRTVQFLGNHCRDGRRNFGETGIDQGGPCP